TLRQRNTAGPAGLRCGPLIGFAAAVNRGLGSRTGAGRVLRELPTEPGPPRALKPPFSRSREKGRFHHGLLECFKVGSLRDAYVAATQAWVPGADAKIVFDKFHVLRIVNEAVDKVRRQSAEGRRRRTAEGHQAPLVGE